MTDKNGQLGYLQREKAKERFFPGLTIINFIRSIN